MWLDMDLLIDKMDFVMPLDTYEGKDLVMHGQAEYILQGEARKGVPAGHLPPRIMHVPCSHTALVLLYSQSTNKCFMACHWLCLL